MKCVNCGGEIEGKFCSNCGQPNPPPEITLNKILHDLQSQFSGLDKMFPRTVWSVTVQPGKTSRTFIQGNRVLYYGPVAYFFLMLTLIFLETGLLNVDFLTFMKSAASAAQPNVQAGSGQEKLSELIVQFINDNIRLVSATLVPLQAFLARFVFFRKSGLTFLQHAVLPFYVQGHIYWITFVGIILFKTTGQPLPYSIVTLTAVLYFGFAFADFSEPSRKISDFLKGVGIYLLSQLLFGIIAIIVVLVIALLMPDIYKMLVS